MVGNETISNSFQVIPTSPSVFWESSFPKNKMEMIGETIKVIPANSNNTCEIPNNVVLVMPDEPSSNNRVKERNKKHNDFISFNPMKRKR
jgi:hypothetical protein